MENYQHLVQYYETDKMGIVHHANYIRWMEEARVDFLSKIGWPYDKLEEEGIISPVTAVACHYRKPCKFAQIITIQVKVMEFRGIRLKIGYQMMNENQEIICDAESEHCFVDENGKPIRVKKQYPEFYQTLSALGESAEEES